MTIYKIELAENTMVINGAFLYFFLKRLTTEFTDTKAYQLGIIDKDGNNLIPRKKFTSQRQYSAYTYFDIMVFNLKKLIAKLPAGKTKIGTLAAALFLLKENAEHSDRLIEGFEIKFGDFYEEVVNIEEIQKIVDQINGELSEDIANSVGAGGIAMYDPPIVFKSQKRKKFRQFM
jgi:hypothetical protein